MGGYNRTDVICSQFEETQDPQRNSVATTITFFFFFFFKVSPGNLAESKNLVEAA